MLVHSEGDHYGKPFRLEDWQKRWIWWLYETEGGRRVTERALLGLPKGCGKTELMAAIGLFELAGGTRTSPEVVVAAASFEQADLVFGSARTMAKEGGLADLVEVFDTEILLRNEPGRMQRVAAAAGTNDGLRPTCLIADELHEWTDRRERVHLVLANGLRKRKGGLELNITTAGVDGSESLCERLYRHGCRVAAGEAEDPGFLFEWWSGPQVEEPPPFDELVGMVAEATPASWLDHQTIARRASQVPWFEWCRYHLNIWTAAEHDKWLPHGAWDNLEQLPQPDDGVEVVLGFDGSYRGDASALVGATLDGHLFTVDVWENPGDPEWRVPREEVRATVQRSFERWKVVRLACDPPGWHRELEEWADTYGDTVVVEWPTNVRTRMAPACNRFYTAVMEGEMTHDGNPVLARHLDNCATKETPQGTLITKETGSRKIDAAVAAVVAYEQSQTLEPVAHVEWLAEWD